MLLHHLKAPDSGFDIEQMVMRLREPIDPAALHGAWERLAQTHAVFRTRFVWDGLPEPLQLVEHNATLPWQEVDWRDLAPEAREARLSEFLLADRRRGFDPRAAPLARCMLIRARAEEWWQVWTFHHMLADGQTYPGLIREVFQYYESIRSGLEAALPAPPTYRSFVEWQRLRQRDLAPRAEAYWRDLLRGFTEATPLPQMPGSDGPTTPRYGEQSLVFQGSEDAARFAKTHGISMPTLVQAAWALVLSRNSGEDDIVFGETRSSRRATIPDAERVVGLCINTLPVRVKTGQDIDVGSWLKELQAQREAVREFEHTPLLEIQRWSEVRAGQPLFHSIVVFTPRLIGKLFEEQGGPWRNRTIQFHERTNYPLALFVYGETDLNVKLAYDQSRFTEQTIARLLRQLETALEALAANPERPLQDVSILPADEVARLLKWNDTRRDLGPGRCIHELIEAQAARTPDAAPLVFRNQSLSYRELNQRANRLARRLKSLGAGPETLAGIYLQRSLDMMVALLAVLKSGAAYVPLDPDYPAERLAWVLEDTRVPIILTDSLLRSSLPAHECATVLVDDPGLFAGSPEETAGVAGGATPENLAYILFTSGSNGRPKGVMIEHRNVVNLFAGMDESLKFDGPGTWLAATSICFDISVLELFWTLSRGFKVVIQEKPGLAGRPASPDARPMDFSLFYFAADAGDPGAHKYRLLLEGAKFADQHGFAAVWTPERHFHGFGGLYPNPSLTSAAIAAITSRIHIRAGSVVLPLHNPIRVAEEWAVVDNLSSGRVGLSFASGWHANDFALMPDHWMDRRDLMLENIEVVRRLWRGESVPVRNGEGKEIRVRIFPAPVQREPQIWITAAKSIETFRTAGAIGANLLTNLLGQKLPDLAPKIQAYRQARKEHGHAGEGHVTLMVHTFVGGATETVRAKVRGPFKEYLRTSSDLIEQARWMFPAFARAGQQPEAHGRVSGDDLEALLDHAFDRYFETSGLFGSVENALSMVERLKDIGVDEIACLIDFGVDTDSVLESLRHLNEVRERSQPAGGREQDDSIAEQIRRHRVTHFQCTPSLAKMLVADPGSRAALRPLKKLLLGGEALPASLAEELAGLTGGDVLNMYGPTETTVWSTTASIEKGRAVTIGRPVANTELYVVDQHLRLAPIGVAGELLIGGAGVGRGYLNRPEQTKESFLVRAFSGAPASRLYRTGDLVRYREDGNLEFLQRVDLQTKILGHRIELGEIETALGAHPRVWETAAAVHQDAAGNARLIGYVVPRPLQDFSGGATDPLTERWRIVWEEIYRSGAQGVSDPLWNTSGWTSSYTGEPLPDADMRQWAGRTVDRIRALRPRRVLEIGCGTGLLLFPLAADCEYYEAVDLSETAIEALRSQVDRLGLRHVNLHQAAAHELSGLASGSFDVVILNSVIQYFPSCDYLVETLEKVAEAVREGGAVFVGDVRSLDLIDAFHTSVELERSAESSSVAELKRRIERRRDNESELLVAPEFFKLLEQRLPRIGESIVELKRGHRRNEMTVFRYDVTLRIGERPAPLTNPAVALESPSLSEMKERLTRKPDSLVATGLKNARLRREMEAIEILPGADCPVSVAKLRKRLSGEVSSHIDPETVWELDPEYGIELSWPAAGGPDRYDAVFQRRGTERRAWPGRHRGGARTLESCVRAPAGKASDADLIRELKDHLRVTLPGYMLPSAIVVRDRLPRTPNGKIDRKMLPRPELSSQSAESGTAPRTEIERSVARVWENLLGMDRVGTDQNFFDLGANSLTMVQAQSLLQDRLGRPVPLIDLFRFPSVGALAAHLDPSRTPSALTGNRTRPLRIGPKSRRIEVREALKRPSAGD